MIIAATREGAFDVRTGEAVLDGRDVVMVSAGEREWWAIADRGRTVLRRPRPAGEWQAGEWQEEVTVEGHPARVVVPLAEGRALVGTKGAHVLVVEEGAAHLQQAFDAVDRSTWYNPASRDGPDVWSAAAGDGSVYVSVHVGGLWRTDDGGETWVNVLEPEVDIHQVAATDDLVVAAAQGGFALSRDRGATWTWTTAGLHAAYLQSVALSGDTVFVGASSGPFGKDAAVYRADPPGERFERRSAGLPDVLVPLAPYHLAAEGDHLAAVEWDSTTVHVSSDAGASWAEAGVPSPVHSLTVV
jgi:photosystem II stability/assembly factor-like uncharacterized protein